MTHFQSTSETQFSVAEVWVNCVIRPHQSNLFSHYFYWSIKSYIFPILCDSVVIIFSYVVLCWYQGNYILRLCTKQNEVILDCEVGRKWDREVWSYQSLSWAGLKRHSKKVNIFLFIWPFFLEYKFLIRLDACSRKFITPSISWLWFPSGHWSEQQIRLVRSLPL